MLDMMRLRLAQKWLGYQMIGTIALQEVVQFLWCPTTSISWQVKRGKKIFVSLLDHTHATPYAIQLTRYKKDILTRINAHLRQLGYRQTIEDIIVRR